MSWGFDKSDLCKQRWQAGYYAQVMELFKHVCSDSYEEDDVAGVSVDSIRRIASSLSKYARVSEQDAEHPSPDMTVHVSLFHREFLSLERVTGYAEGGGVPGWYWPDCDDKGWWQAVAAKSKSYFDERDRRAEAAAREAERRRAENEEKRRQKAEREDVLLQRIRDYVADCNDRHEVPVKRSLADDEFSYSVVLRVWKRLDEEPSVRGGRGENCS